MNNFKKIFITVATGLFIFTCNLSFAQRTISYYKQGADPDGFRGIKWGQFFDSVEDMIFVRKELSDTDTLVYTKTDEKLKIGYVELSKIEYSFWQNKFYKVVIYTDGVANWKGLQESTFEKFGRGFQLESKKEEYSWFGNTRMTLSYDEDSKKGTLTMISKEISLIQQEHDW